jgi:hypothetical protein
MAVLPANCSPFERCSQVEPTPLHPVSSRWQAACPKSSATDPRCALASTGDWYVHWACARAVRPAGWGPSRKPLCGMQRGARYDSVYPGKRVSSTRGRRNGGPAPPEVAGWRPPSRWTRRCRSRNRARGRTARWMRVMFGGAIAGSLWSCWTPTPF